MYSQNGNLRPLLLHNIFPQMSHFNKFSVRSRVISQDQLSSYFCYHDPVLFFFSSSHHPPHHRRLILFIGTVLDFSYLLPSTILYVYDIKVRWCLLLKLFLGARSRKSLLVCTTAACCCSSFTVRAIVVPSCFK